MISSSECIYTAHTCTVALPYTTLQLNGWSTRLKIATTVNGLTLTATIETPAANTESKINPAIVDVVEIITMWGVVATTVILLSLTWV